MTAGSDAVGARGPSSSPFETQDREESAAFVRSVLREYGALTRRELQTYLPDGEPQDYLYKPLREYPARGGKMMRPSLCLAAASVFGGSPQHALRTAVSIELLHNALLIHDDIQDYSEERRGLPTMHELVGMPLAINVGDMMTLMSLRPLFENHRALGGRMAMCLIEETERMTRESAEGQAMELGWRRDNVVDLDARDYLVMVLKKTCWLATIFPLRAGALIARRGAYDLEPITRFGFFLGAAFQIRDDILNLVGDRKRYGKEINGDLLEGKRTLMILHVLKECTPAERAELTEYLGWNRQQREQRGVDWLLELIDRYEALEYANGIAHGLAGAAHQEYEGIFGHLPDSRDKRFLKEVVTWVLDRR